ncbi:hypothetical protein G7Y89_g6557 [Cudoniella acicularis]|uniref:Uncharacterized protein n=1 Tax=Cudoniella acicularis TaxID=354080 RepID=A0A8H4RK81_9HELO|nr:hypothetical protein G7Y89_g6557 [Cudoniella acicularis]
MAHKEREGEVEERPSERRHRSKSEKDPTKKHKSSRSSRPKVIDPETGEVVKSPHRSRKDKDQDKKSEPSKSMADLVPELARTASAPGATSRGSIPYPSFNKAHSKEAVSSREDFRLPTRAQPNVYTPESTDLGSEEKLRSKSAEHFTPPRGAATFKDGRPPSPPETDISQQRKATPSRMTKVQEEVKTESRPSSRNSWFSRSTKERDEGSKVSSKSKASKASTAIKSPQFKADGEDEKKERVVETQDDSTESEADSNLTSVAPKREPSRAGPPPPALDTDSSPESAQDSSPQTLPKHHNSRRQM